MDGLAVYRVASGIHIFSLMATELPPLAGIGTDGERGFVPEGRARETVAFMSYVDSRARYEKPTRSRRLTGVRKDA
jgi:hypothetical protein